MTPATLNSQVVESWPKVEQLCRICGARGPHSLYTAREMMFGLRDEFDYFECNSCGCLQIQVIPLDISPYYPENYYAHNVSPDKRFANPAIAVLRRLKARYDLSGGEFLGRKFFEAKQDSGLRSLGVLNPSRESSILDVGCGNGERLYKLREIGFRNLLGVDPFIAGDRTYKNGLSIEKKNLSQVSGTWDFIMFHHSFEHMDSPVEMLQQVRRLLKPSGQCIIRIPTVSSYAWRHYRTDWVQLDAPRHYFLHSQTSIEYLARATDLRVTSVCYDSSGFQFWGSELYLRDIPLTNGPRSLGKSDIRKFQARAKQLNAANDGDAAAFYLTHA
jgi:SAM-dependent methyltransferase